METWKEIKGYEGFYEISSEGRVKSLKRADCKCRTKDRLLTPERLQKGYLRVRKNELVQTLNPTWMDLANELFPNVFE